MSSAFSAYAVSEIRYFLVLLQLSFGASKLQHKNLIQPRMLFTFLRVINKIKRLYATEWLPEPKILIALFFAKIVCQALL